MKIAIIPDCQVKPGVDLSHLTWLGKYLAEKEPDVIVNIGDFADLPSLSSYDARGSKSYEGRRYVKDVDAARTGMDRLIAPLLNIKYKPRLVLTLGNHEERINRAVEADPRLEGTISLSDLRYEEAGWQVVPFLKPVQIGGVNFCHYLPSGIMGRPCMSARKLINKYHESCVVGHQQGLDIAMDTRANGKRVTAIIAGSFYRHSEAYLTPTTNNHWRGMLMLHEVKAGSFDPMFVSIDYLQKRFK